MSAFLTVLYAVLPVVCVALSGALMRRVNWLNKEADDSLMRVVINVFYPCLVLDNVLGNKALENLGTLMLAPAVGFGTVAVGIAIAWLAVRWRGADSTVVQRTFALVTGIYNYGYVPLPLALTLFDRETAGVLFVHNVGVELALWSIGYAVLTGHKLEHGWRKFITVPLLAVAVALPLNLLGAQHFLPVFVLETVKLLGQCAIPLGLVLVGATMADYAGEFKLTRIDRLSWLAVLVRMAVLPVLFLVLAKYLPAPKELRHVILLQAAMPAAVFPIIMSKHYGGDAPLAVRIVVATSLVSVLTIPLVIRLGMHWLGG